MGVHHTMLPEPNHIMMGYDMMHDDGKLDDDDDISNMNSGISLVRMELLGIMEALEWHPNTDYIINLSAHDYPIKSVRIFL